MLYLLVNCLFALGYLLTGDGVENARPDSFADAFFFSVQTMATIGFGKMSPRTIAAHVLVTIEAFTTLLALALSTGLFFAKFSRPTALVLFSKAAVVSPWDGVPSLMFRMANERDNRIIDAQVNVALLRKEVTAENVTVRRVHDLELLRKHHPTFALSWTAIHPIDERSPLLGVTAASLAAADWFIIVSLTGLDETYSQTVHARHTYLPEDIAWDARFTDILSRRPDGQTVFDYRCFTTRFPSNRSKLQPVATGTTNAGSSARRRRRGGLRLSDGTWVRFPAVMGVLNVTPDSFSDGGRYLDPKRAVVRGAPRASRGGRLAEGCENRQSFLGRKLWLRSLPFIQIDRVGPCSPKRDAARRPGGSWPARQFPATHK